MAVLNDAQRLELVHRFQHAHDTGQIRVDGLRVWPMVMYELVKLTGPSLLARSMMDTLKLAFKELFAYGRMAYDKHRDRANSAGRSALGDVLLLTQSTRRVLLDGSYFDRMCDPFVDVLRQNGYQSDVWEWSYDHRYRIPRHNPSSLIQDDVDRVIMRSLLPGHRLDQKFELLETPEFRAVLDGFGASHGFFVGNLLRSVRFTLALKSYFLRRLERVRARLAFFFPYYGVVSSAFNLACRERGIYTVEIQHGYNGDTMLMHAGFRNINCQYDLMPDAIWAWEERDREAVARWGSDQSALPFVYVGGNLWNKFWKYPEANVNRYVSASLGNALRQDGHGLALLTLPPLFEIPEWLPEAIRSTVGDTRWCIRYHHNTKRPAAAEYRRAFRNLTNVEYDLANRLPLPVLMRTSDVHVTAYSSSVAEAREFDKKSIIISEMGTSTFSPVIKEGWAFPALCADELRRVLRVVLNEERNRPVQAEPNVISNAAIVSDFLAGLGDRITAPGMAQPDASGQESRS